MIDLESPGELVTSQEIKQRLTSSVVNLFTELFTSVSDQRTVAKFPGGHPVSFSRESYISGTDYLVTEKSDGVRYLLYIQRIPGLRGIVDVHAYLIDRKFGFWNIIIQVPATMLVGDNLFDCELVLDHKTEPTILIFDTLFSAGVCFINNTYLERLQIAWQSFIYPIRMAQMNSRNQFKIYLKDFFKQDAVEFIWKNIMDRLPHTCDGLIFTKNNAPYMIGTNPNILKWKPPRLNTIDFSVYPTATAEVFDLFTRGFKLEFFDQIHIYDQSAADFIRSTPGIIVECTLDPSQGWQVYKPRTDKNTPNNTEVARNIMKSIKENLEFPDLVSLITSS